MLIKKKTKSIEHEPYEVNTSVNSTFFQSLFSYGKQNWLNWQICMHRNISKKETKSCQHIGFELCVWWTVPAVQNIRLSKYTHRKTDEYQKQSRHLVKSYFLLCNPVTFIWLKWNYQIDEKTAFRCTVCSLVTYWFFLCLIFDGMFCIS